ncbi:MAG: aminomethyl transferase family protein [Verrucomicrobia bacterium]|nr:aminomethyl transferase family protein [Verrucomicrobiota bacterium]
MNGLALHDFHARRGAVFAEVNGAEVVAHHGDALAEHAALRAAAAVLDLSCRGRLGLTGADRQRLLNGQVTNNVAALRPGDGCYAAFCSAKGKMQADANILCLPGEFLLDLEPGTSATVAQRLEQYIIADDVQVTDAAPLCGLLSVQGPKSREVIARLGLGVALPSAPLGSASAHDSALGEIHCVNHSRVGLEGFDLFVPRRSLEAAAERLLQSVAAVGGRFGGWQALEIARIEAGIPRFGQDMDDTNLPPECGLEARAISYTKGCYIGQEVIARLKSIGQVTKTLCGLKLDKDLKFTPRRADRLYRGDREIGYVTSFLVSPTLNANVALAYVRREHGQLGIGLVLRAADGACTALVVALPFRADPA